MGLGVDDKKIIKLLTLLSNFNPLDFLTLPRPPPRLPRPPTHIYQNTYTLSEPLKEQMPKIQKRTSTSSSSLTATATFRCDTRNAFVDIILNLRGRVQLYLCL